MIINVFEHGVILRLGKYSRMAPPGVCWKWPLLEEVLYTETAIATINLCAQTLTTKDRKQLVVETIIKYEIKDVKPYLLEVVDRDDILNDVTLGAVQRAISYNTYDDIFSDIKRIEEQVLKNVRIEINKLGFKIHKITFSTIGVIKTIRLITESGSIEVD